MPVLPEKVLILGLQVGRVSSFAQNKWCLLLALSKSIIGHNHKVTNGGKKNNVVVGRKKESDEFFHFIRQAVLKKILMYYHKY